MSDTGTFRTLDETHKEGVQVFWYGYKARLLLPPRGGASGSGLVTHTEEVFLGRFCLDTLHILHSIFLA